MSVTKRKNPHAVALGRRGGKKGGKARLVTMTPEERRESARKAARARWARVKAQRASPKMTNSSAAKTPGERAFEHYLGENTLQFTYQPKDLGEGKRPDYLVETLRGKVLCEITDLLPGKLDKPVAKQLEASRHEVEGGWFISSAVGCGDLKAMHLRVRDKIEAELLQLTPFRGRFPCVVMLYKPVPAMVFLDESGILGALWGFLTREMNTALSALAVIDVTQPYEREYGRVVRGHRKDEGRHPIARGGWQRPSRDDLLKGFDLYQKENRDWGGAIAEEHPYLQLYYNPFAAVPLPASAFPGPYDIHKRLVPDKRGGFAAFKIPWGPRGGRVPDVRTGDR